VQSREIAEAEGLPAKFLESILLALKSNGILESKVGAGGGYRLRRPAEETRILEIVITLEPEDSGFSEGDMTLGIASLSELRARCDEARMRAIGMLSVADVVSLGEARMSLEGVGVR